LAAPLISPLPRGPALISCLTLTDVMRVAQEATRAHEEFTPLAALTTTGGSSYAELLLRVRGRLALTTIGVFRDVSESQLQADISLALSVRASELGLA
jgi:hypothetical protein